MICPFLPCIVSRPFPCIVPCCSSSPALISFPPSLELFPPPLRCSPYTHPCTSSPHPLPPLYQFAGEVNSPPTITHPIACSSRHPATHSLPCSQMFLTYAATSNFLDKALMSSICSNAFLRYYVELFKGYFANKLVERKFSPAGSPQSDGQVCKGL